MQPRAVWMQLAVVVAVLGYPGNDTAAQCIDQHPVEALTSNVDPIGQSWTSTCDGELRYLVVRADLPNPGTHTLSIYAGQSVAAGDLIASQSGILLADGENRIRLDDLPWITSGSEWTHGWPSVGFGGLWMSLKEMVLSLAERYTPPSHQKRIMAVNADSGQRLWENAERLYRGLAAMGYRVTIFEAGKELLPLGGRAFAGVHGLALQYAHGQSQLLLYR